MLVFGSVNFHYSNCNGFFVKKVESRIPEVAWFICIFERRKMFPKKGPVLFQGFAFALAVWLAFCSKIGNWKIKKNMEHPPSCFGVAFCKVLKLERTGQVIYILDHRAFFPRDFWGFPYSGGIVFSADTVGTTHCRRTDERGSWGWNLWHQTTKRRPHPHNSRE